MPDANAEIYTADGKLQWAARFSPLHLVSVVTQTAASVGGAPYFGTWGSTTFVFSTSIARPLVAFRSASPIGFYLVSQSGGNWRYQVWTRSNATADVTAYIFSDDPPPAVSGGLEMFNTSGVRTFSLACRPARIVGRADSGAPFSGDSSRRYAVLKPSAYAQRVAIDQGGGNFTIQDRMGIATINDGAGSVTMGFAQYTNYSAPDPVDFRTETRGDLKALILDVTNY
ncbi:hypothetical protein YP76_09915 [Sphingobium chungbukense]|uniref:Uncharacterized protein n=2 Tax=Sphingobium chungbukense TaxID=56193 RepID=A0A0M3AQR4_9SPHN|nr:hypothetical protein YP76_09915 [Sphingobium chungbukense]